MFGQSIKLFRLFGFEVKIDLSWIILAVLITWSLAEGLFPYYYKDLSRSSYWWMGGFGAIGLFLSIIFHEMSHSLVARRYGLPMKGITLFIFGGIAEMEDEPASPKVEFMMAIAGPVASLVISLLFYSIYRLGVMADWSVKVNAVAGYLAWINVALAVFNMLPAFPLDGGRVLRSGLWKWKNNIRWATRVSSQIGSAFGMGLIILGIMNILIANLVGGFWWVLIGMFLRNASSVSYRQLVIRRALQGESVERFMSTDVVTVPPSLSVERVVDEYFYKYHYKFFPVVENSHIVGCINTQQIQQVPREDWPYRTVEQIVRQCAPDNAVRPHTDSVDVLAQMNRSQQSRLMVVEDDRLLGVVTLKDMLQFLAVKLDLEGDRGVVTVSKDMDQQL
jgi:Zn-dependent protease/predicted transcriptional regulator